MRSILARKTRRPTLIILSHEVLRKICSPRQLSKQQSHMQSHMQSVFEATSRRQEFLDAMEQMLVDERCDEEMISREVEQERWDDNMPHKVLLPVPISGRFLRLYEAGEDDDDVDPVHGKDRSLVLLYEGYDDIDEGVEGDSMVAL